MYPQTYDRGIKNSRRNHFKFCNISLSFIFSTNMKIDRVDYIDCDFLQLSLYMDWAIIYDFHTTNKLYVFMTWNIFTIQIEISTYVSYLNDNGQTFCIFKYHSRRRYQKLNKSF